MVRSVGAQSLPDPVEVLRGIAEEAGIVKPNRKAFRIDAAKLRDVVLKLRQVYGEDGVYLATIVGVDLPEENTIEVNYFIHLIPRGETIVLRTKTNRDDPRLPTLIDILPGALAGECETYDLLGVVFEGNPYLRRAFFVPQEVASQGIYPLRKDAAV